MRRRAIEDRFWSKVDKTPGLGPWGDCWEWRAATNGRGYGYFGLEAGKNVSAHRLAYLLSGRELQAGDVVRHRCDNPLCCNPAHLLSGTPAQNSQDMKDRARHRTAPRRGEAHGRCKLSDAEVDELRRLHKESGWTQRALADRYGVSTSQVNRIVLQKNR